MCMAYDEAREAFQWMDERRTLFERYNHDGSVRPRGGRVPLSQARAHVKDCEARPEIMRAWTSAPVDAEISDDDWDLITDFKAYLWVKSGCRMDVLDAIGGAVRRLASREFDSSESDAIDEHLLRDPRIVDDRPRGR